MTSQSQFKPTTLKWVYACESMDIPENEGACVKIGNQQIAVFNFTRLNQWFATQNQCPHRKQMAISRGMIGTQGDEPKVACPFHKKTFSLQSGMCLNDELGALKTYDIKVVDGKIFIKVEVSD